MYTRSWRRPQYYILTSTLTLYALFVIMTLPLQLTMAQTIVGILHFSNIITNDVKPAQYYYINSKNAPLIPNNQLLGTTFKDVIWKNVPTKSNLIHYIAIDPANTGGRSLIVNSSNCTTIPTAAGLLNATAPLRKDLRIGDKNYTITYDITGNSNRLDGLSAQTGNATILLNITSINNGNLTIDLPRKVVDSKTLGNMDTHFLVSEIGRGDIHCLETNNTPQKRSLAFDFVKGTGQISITGTNIYPSNQTAPKVILIETPLIVNESSLVVLNGSGSHDPEGEPVTFNWRQTSGPNVQLKGGNASIATFTAPRVSNDTKMSFNLNVMDKAGLANNATETVVVKHIARTPLMLTPTGVNATAAFHAIIDSKLPYYFLGVIASAMVIPLIIDMILAFRKKRKEDTSGIVGMPGLYRTLMTFGVILLVGTILFYILVLITVNINTMMTPTLQSLIDVFKNLATILGTALASIIAFYFGMKGRETISDNRASTSAAVSTMPTPEDNTPPVVVDTFPRDGTRDVPVDSLVTASFSKRIDTSTINANTFSVKRDGTTTNVLGIVLLSPDGKTAIFRSEQSFSPSTKYFVTIDAAVRDDSGNALASIKIWSFTTINTASIT